MSGQTLRRLDIATMLRTPPPPVRWIGEGLVPSGGVTILAGAPGVGKSMMAMTLGVAVASGTEFLGANCSEGAVMYVDAENGDAETHRRLVSSGLDLQASPNLHYFASEGHNLVHHRDEIIRLAKEISPALVILDSLRSLWAGDENDSGQAERVMQTARALANETGAGVLVLHHTPKHSESSRGSSAFKGAVDLEALLTRPSEGDQDVLALRVTKCRCAAAPADRFVRVGFDGGVLAVTEADAVRNRRPVEAEVCDLLMGVLPDCPDRISQSEACRAIGRDTNDRTVRKALSSLRESGVAAKDERGWFRPTGGVYSDPTPTQPSTPDHRAVDYESVLKQVPR